VSARILFLGAVAVGLWVSSAGAQQIYQWRDTQGTVHFSDKPPPYPAVVTIDGEISPPTASPPSSAPAKSTRPSSYSRPRSQRSRSVAFNRSISSLIDGGPRSRLRGTTLDPPASDSSSASFGTALNDPSDQPAPVKRNARATRRSSANDDMSVPSLDGALSGGLSGDSAAGTNSSPARRQPAPPAQNPPLETAGP
jgi:hypothetical protein